MLTKNFKNLMAIILERSSVNIGLLPVVAYNGTEYWLVTNSSNSYPGSVTTSLTTSASGAGICVGSGSMAATENDYNLEAQITSGLSSSVIQNAGLDNDNNPYVTFDITITNTGNNDVIIREIGYRQNLYAATAQGGTSVSNRVCLLDRTILSAPITIPAGEFGVVRYMLKTIRG